MRVLQYFSLILSAFLLFSCGNDSETPQKEGVGGKFYGGTFRFMSSEKVQKLFPLAANDIYAQRLNAQIFETLLSLDSKTLEVKPCLASSYQVNEDATCFTFNIRKGVQFHEDDCFKGKKRFLTAEDIKFSLEMACTPERYNDMTDILVSHIVGGDVFYRKSANKHILKGIPGIRVLDPYTLEIRLKESFRSFDKILTNSTLGIFPREAIEKYGDKVTEHPVGTGPFILESMSFEQISLVRNPNYWRTDDLGNKLPFLDQVIMTYAQTKRSEIMAFRNKEIDLVLEIPVDEIQNILGSLKEAQAGKNVTHRVESHPGMKVSFLAFDCSSKEFSDVRVRRAFNLVLDRKHIVESWLSGEGWATQSGFVPNIPGFDSDKVNGYTFDAEQARTLMAQAGYSKTKKFPTLDLYVNAKKGSAQHKMCLGIVAQLKNTLGISMRIRLCTYKEWEKAVASGKAKIWRSGWVADYPGADNFLGLFYSGNMGSNKKIQNEFHFLNERFNSMFEDAAREGDPIKRESLLIACDQLIVDEVPAIPILTDDVLIMINARVRDFYTNSMEVLDFSSIFIKEPRR
jgi:oligopeptide transport system substrate-binding protein